MSHKLTLQRHLTSLPPAYGLFFFFQNRVEDNLKQYTMVYITGSLLTECRWPVDSPHNGLVITEHFRAIASCFGISRQIFFVFISNFRYHFMRNLNIPGELCPYHGYWFGCSWWRHQRETFFASLAFVRGIHLSPVNSPHKGQWRRALMFYFICAWTTAE